MHINILIILLVILNNSTLFGGVHASSTLESEYASGNVFEIEHSHGHKHGLKGEHANSEQAFDWHNAVITEADSDHSHSHKHGFNAQLSCVVPKSYTFEVETSRNAIEVSSAIPILSPIYTPPLPPPNL